ncbi:MAG: hypothetical protein IKC02_03615 [Oscillospiraceae bacterium]|nr:hypothetical protein [Oscillospiraceae bacterium]
MKKKRMFYIVPILAALVLLGSCNLSQRPNDPKSSGTDISHSFPAQITVSAEPYAGPSAGGFYNSSTGALLRLDGAGEYVLSASGLYVSGEYSAGEDELVLLGSGEEARLHPSGEGYVLSGMAGIFLPLEEKGKFSDLGVIAQSDREYMEESGGTYRLSDYTLQLALRYPAGMSAPENLVADAVVIWDKASSYVTGRNVTELYQGDAEDFMSDYMQNYVLPDFRLLYGKEGSFDSLTPLDEGIAGRIASSEALIKSEEESIYVKCIMYTSTYSDGTVNYICKSFYVPEGDQDSLTTLTNSVVNMTAVRRK